MLRFLPSMHGYWASLRAKETCIWIRRTKSTSVLQFQAIVKSYIGRHKRKAQHVHVHFTLSRTGIEQFLALEEALSQPHFQIFQCSST